MDVFPGQAGVVPLTDIQLHQKYFMMMLDAWQANFAMYVDWLTDPTYTFTQLVKYMSNQQIFHNAAGPSQEWPRWT